MTALDKSLVLEVAGPGIFRTQADPAFKGAVGMFGGWLAALMLKSVLDSPASEGTLSALTLNFIKGVLPGSALSLHTSRLGGGHSLAHWRCDLFIEDGSEFAATAIIVLANRRQSERHTELRMPDAAAPESLPVVHPPSSSGEHVDARIALGHPFRDKGSTRSLTWLRDMSQRPLDALQLVSQCDNLAPRILYISESEGPRPSPTVTFSVYVHATDDEMASVGSEFILSEVIGTRIEHSTSGSRSNLWSRDGVLLATSEQLQWFK